MKTLMKAKGKPPAKAPVAPNREVDDQISSGEDGSPRNPYQNIDTENQAIVGDYDYDSD
jgi:hypothetical protein